jgi:hypothetical protein
MERIHPTIHHCPFGMLCMSSAVALLVFLIALFLVG